MSKRTKSFSAGEEDILSPAERYSRAQSRRRFTALSDFEQQLSFELDSFQRAACESLELGRSVLVAAPTGSGKTVVGEFGIELAMRDLSDRAFYTAPIKALSNQKYQELCERYGHDQVGLLTGDTSINARARIVVMTTEVLRNMIYAESSDLDQLAFVILDEVHYLADKFRGAVWEEIILHLPQQVKLISLSATVSNAEEFGDWLQTVRGDTDVIVSEHRPVPLFQHVLTQGNLLPLFSGDASGTNKQRSVLNPEVKRLAGFGQRRGSQQGRGGASRPRHPGPRAQTATKADIVRALDGHELLPGIVFVFSRKGCDEAVRSCIRQDVRLTSPDERAEIRDLVLERTAALSSSDLDALDFHGWRAGLERGVAAHHAGLLPLFKEIVEELFQARLVKVVFATETLALGINMPARSVVIEKLDKFNGESRVPLTSGEYTQLTGRAGRRGIDHEGHAIVVWHDSINPEELAQLASKRTYPLISSFRPTYNMSVNLLDSFGYDKARSLLERSFAQFQADHETSELIWRVKKQEESLAGYLAAMECHLGDFLEYATLRRRISDIESGSKPSRSRAKAKSAHQRRQLDSLQQLRRELNQHPCHRCEERETHARWGERYTKLLKQTDSLRDAVNRRTKNIARQFDRVLQMLQERGYVARESGNRVVTDWGRKLKYVFGDRDLLSVESVREHAWDTLSPAQLAAITACLVFESRRDSAGRDVALPRGEFLEALKHTQRIWDELDEMEESLGLPQTEQIDAQPAQAILHWAGGGELDYVLDIAELSAGDFVRLVKQTIDLLEQLSDVASPQLAATAIESIGQLRRGIVALSSVQL